MKTKIVVLVFLILSVLRCDYMEKKEVKLLEEIETLKVMTYNIRLDVAVDSSNAWSNRKDFLSSQILFLEPDIIGVQEARPNQIEDLNTALPNYDHIGIGRDGGSKGEHSAIYYNTEKLEVLEHNTFWLSKTPTEISKGWDAAYPRICTYGLFSAKENNKFFWVFNTHLDHFGVLAQKEGMKLILSKIAIINTENYPVVLMGDFNVEPNSDVIGITQEMMFDSKKIAKLIFGNEGTFNGFRYNELAKRRIDYILLSKDSGFEVEKYAVLTSAVNFRFPSDHFPVFVELKIK